MLNRDFTQRVVIDTAQQPWVPSPAGGVLRKPLSRAEAERGQVTSIVQYRPGARFPEHKHPMGEEIFVLEGVFSDEHGDYPAGSYLRNPPGSAHSPHSDGGCVLFVKLDQFDSRDLSEVRVGTNSQPWLPGIGGLQVMPLHEFEHEHVALVKWPANEKFQPHRPPHRHVGGEEILVLSGEFCDEHARYPKGSWIRSPHGSEHHPFVEQETVIWVKTGHLPIE